MISAFRVTTNKTVSTKQLEMRAGKIFPIPQIYSSHDLCIRFGNPTAVKSRGFLIHITFMCFHFFNPDL